MTMRREVRFIPIEGSDAAAGPSEAYLMPHPTEAGRFILGTGDKAGEATAFLENTSGDVFRLNDAVAEEDRTLYLTDSSRVIV